MKKKLKAALLLVVIIAMTVAVTGNTFAAGNSEYVAYNQQIPSQQINTPPAQTDSLMMAFSLYGGYLYWNIAPFSPYYIITINDNSNGALIFMASPTVSSGYQSCYYTYGHLYTLTLHIGVIAVYSQVMCGL